MNQLKRKEYHRENTRNRRMLQKQKIANIQPNCILEPIAENCSLPKYNTDTEVKFVGTIQSLKTAIHENSFHTLLH